jgi:ATPase subunit of ABC transporter with duplicated ATPase domains
MYEYVNAHLMKATKSLQHRFLTLNSLTEPTNHLDLESVEWLEEFLRQQKIPTIIVSHDREFLDQVCTKIVDAEGGLCTEYDGNYSRFLALKKGTWPFACH